MIGKPPREGDYKTLEEYERAVEAYEYALLIEESIARERTWDLEDFN